MNTKNVIIASLAALLMIASGAGYYAVNERNKKINDLEKQIAALNEKEKRNAVDREVSRQLEKIAFDQEQISDARRIEAEQQYLRAQQMTQQAQMERIKAEKAEQEAHIAAANAIQERNNAERQRLIAEEKQREAEYSKSVVDTLSFVGLGRSLASLSVTQYLAGEKETATLLAGASYYFTETYNGDFFDQSVFQALLLASGGSQIRRPGVGSITAAEYTPDGNLLSVSSYGEIFKCEQEQTKKVFGDKNYSFRDLKIIGDTAFALSFTGDLFMLRNNTAPVIIPLEGIDRSFCLSRLENGKLLIAAENTLSVFDIRKSQIIKTITCDHKISCVSRGKVFDEAGQMFTIDGNLNLQKINKPQLKGIVTAYTESPHGSFAAYGTKDGMIYFESKDGLWAELAGHLSQISDLQISGRGLFSSSFDKTVKLWIANEGKGIPITVYTATSWVTCLATKTDGTRIVTGNANGELVVNPISVEEMKNALKLSLKRDLTKDEWDKYIGKTIPYTSIMDKL